MTPQVLGAVLGLALGVGVYLSVAAFVWPAETREVRQTPSILSGLEARLEGAGLSMRPGGFVAVSVMGAVFVGALVTALVGVVAFAAAAALCAVVAPFAALSWRARSRRRRHRAVWPDIVDHLVSAVRSGLTLPDAIAALADSGPETTRPSFRAFVAEYEASANMSIALDDLKRRLADPIADRVIETVRMSREVGGTELATVLRGLSAHLRQEAAIRSEVEARQSWVVNAARIGAAAPWIVLLLLATRPEAAAAYNTAAGMALVAGGLVITVVAYRVMLAVGRLPEEERWFR